MDILHSLYDIVSGLGSFLLIPVFFFLLGLASRAGVQRSGQCALAVLGSTVAIQLLISTLSGQLVTLVNTMIDTYSLSTGAANLHWQKAAEVTLNSDVLYWVLPGAVLLNLLMLACRVTRVLNMDLWSLWGLILGFIMGMAAGLPLYDAVSFALVAAGCLFALPRLLRVFGRAAASVLEPLTARKTCHGRLPLNVAVNAVVGTANATTLLSAIILVPVTVALAAVLPGNLVLPQGDVAMLLYLMIFVTAMSGGCLLRSLVTGLISAIVMLYSGTLLTYLFTAAAKAMDAATYGAGEFNTLCNTANPLSLLFVEGASFGIAGIAALAVLVLGLCFLAGRRLRRMTHRLAAQLAAAAAEETPTEEN